MQSEPKVTDADRAAAEKIRAELQAEYGDEVWIGRNYESGGEVVEKVARAIAAAREEGRASWRADAIDSSKAPDIAPMVWVNGKRCPPKGHVLDDAGVVRKVDTTRWDPANIDKAVPLPVYADGELWMMGEDAYVIFGSEVSEFFPTREYPEWTSIGWVLRWGDGEIELNKCYSTRESALAAKEANGSK
jgi:hypothetical protein